MNKRQEVIVVPALPTITVNHKKKFWTQWLKFFFFRMLFWKSKEAILGSKQKRKKE